MSDKRRPSLFEMMVALGKRLTVQPKAKKVTHDNPLRRIGREMAAMAAKNVRASKVKRDATGAAINHERREKNALRRQMARNSGRQWVKSRKALERADRALREVR